MPDKKRSETPKEFLSSISNTWRKPDQLVAEGPGRLKAKNMIMV